MVNTNDIITVIDSKRSRNISDPMDMTNKTLLFIGAGIEAVPGIKLAKEMGLRVIASDGNSKAPGLAFADDPLIASTYDIPATVRAVSLYHDTVHPIDGVICIGCDAQCTMASVALAVGAPGIQMESANLAADKLAMKRKFLKDGIPIPWFSEVENENVLRKIVSQIGFPLILKPVDSRGSRGVLRLTSDINLDWAWKYTKSKSPTGRVMVEEYLVGPQISTESLVIHGVTHTPTLADRNYEYLERYAPYIIENGGQLPSHLPNMTQRAIRELVQKSAHSMGIEHGVVKGDIVVKGGRPYVIEMAVRLSGGFLCTHEIPLNTGVDFVRHAIRLALGEKPSIEDLVPRFQKDVVQRWIFPSPGRIVAIEGVDDARGQEGIAEIIIRANVGDIATPPTDSNAAVGVVMAVGDSRIQAIERAELAVRTIGVITEPL